MFPNHFITPNVDISKIAGFSDLITRDLCYYFKRKYYIDSPLHNIVNIKLVIYDEMTIILFLFLISKFGVLRVYIF